MAKKAAPQKPSAEHKRIENAICATLKLHRGSKLTQAETRDYKFWIDLQQQKLIHDYLRAIPKGVFCAMAARQQKVIDEQAERYDLPIDGPTVDLFVAIKAYHDLITSNYRVIRPADDAELVANGIDLDDAPHHELQTEKLRQEVVKLRQSNERLAIQVTRDRGDSIDRRELRDLLTWLSTRLEGLGQQLRSCSDGTESQKTLNEFLEHMADEVEHGVLRV